MFSLNELSRKTGFGVNAADKTGGDENRIGFVGGKPRLCRLLACQVELLAPRYEDLTVLVGKPAHDGRTRHAAMAGNIDRFAA